MFDEQFAKETPEEVGGKIVDVAQLIFAALNAGDVGMAEGITGQAYALGKSLEMFSGIAGPAMGRMLTNKVLTAIAAHAQQSAPSVQ